MLLYIFIIILVFLLLFVLLLISHSRFSLKGAHVLITGGSSGFGESLAKEVVKHGASVTLFARNLNKLQEAKVKIEALVADPLVQKVQINAVDVTDDYEKIQEALTTAEKRLGPVDMLINCAGISLSKAIEDLSIAEVKRLMDVNIVGSISVTKAVIPHMKMRRMGRVVFISSQAGQAGVFGYTAYSASKFALTGLAQALQMEVKLYNIKVMVSYPPDMDTPGYRDELLTKPEELKLISETSGLYDADVVAKKVIQDSVKGRFTSCIGFDGWMLNVLTAGMAPMSTHTEMIEQVAFMSIFRVVSFFFHITFDRIMKKCHIKRQMKQN